MWARARSGRAHDIITTAIGMLAFAFGRAPLDGEGALPVWRAHDIITTAIGMLAFAFGRAPFYGEGALLVHWRKPAHMDAWRPPKTLSEGVEKAVHRGNSEVIRRSFGGIRILWREFGRLDLACDVAVHMKRALQRPPK